MHRQRIGTERIEHDEPISTVGCAFEALPGIAQNHLNRFRLAIAQIREKPRIASDPFHGPVDFIKRPTLARLGIACQGSHAQTHNRDLRSWEIESTLDRTKELTDRPG